jgi:hypothetical protein
MFRSRSSPLSAYEFLKCCNKCSLVVAVAAQSLCLPSWLQITTLDPTWIPPCCNDLLWWGWTKMSLSKSTGAGLATVYHPPPMQMIEYWRSLVSFNSGLNVSWSTHLHQPSESLSRNLQIMCICCLPSEYGIITAFKSGWMKIQPSTQHPA